MECELSKCKHVDDLEHELSIAAARWNYIKTDTKGARALLLLLENGKGTPDDFDTLVDRIIESRRIANIPICVKPHSGETDSEVAR